MKQSKFEQDLVSEMHDAVYAFGNETARETDITIIMIASQSISLRANAWRDFFQTLINDEDLFL